MTESYKKEYKLQLHINLHKLKNRGKKKPAREPREEGADAANGTEAEDGDDAPHEIAMKKEWDDKGCKPSQAWPRTSSKAVGPSQPTVELAARRRRHRRN